MTKIIEAIKSEYKKSENNQSDFRKYIYKNQSGVFLYDDMIIPMDIMIEMIKNKEVVRTGFGRHQGEMMEKYSIYGYYAMSKEGEVFKSNITVCDWNNKGDIVPIEIDNRGEIEELVRYWVYGKSSTSVFVCFNSFSDVEYRDEHPTFVVTQTKWEVLEYAIKCEELLGGKIDFNIFEFENWEEASIYINDLKEGV